MPDRGLLQRETVEPTALGDSPRALALTDARWTQITFEVSQKAALALMPCDVSRPIPCYARLLVAEGQHFGQRLAIAALTVGGRYRMMPRNLLVQAVVDGNVEALTGVFGSGVVAGTVTLTRDGGALRAEVGAAGEQLAQLVLPALFAIEPTMLRWDAWLGFAEYDGSAVITEMLISAESRTAHLSKGATVEMDSSLPRTHTWRSLRNLLTVSACYAEGTFTIGAPEIQQTWT